MSELTHTPYREIPLENLGALTPLKTINKPDKPETLAEEAEDDGYETITKEMRENYLSKNEIFHRISSFLDGFNSVETQQSW